MAITRNFSGYWFWKPMISIYKNGFVYISWAKWNFSWGGYKK